MTSCVICGAEQHPLAKACPRCKRIIERIDTRRDESGRTRRIDKKARLQALQDSWDDDAGVFRCFYTGVALVEDDWRDHRYPTIEHRTPGDESSVVITSALINRMKTDLSEPEFRRLIAELAKHFDGQAFDEEAFPKRKFTPSTSADR